MMKIKDLVSQAGRWLGITSPAPAPAAVTAVRGDRFDDMTWQEITGQAPALGNLVSDLGERHNYAADLVRDVFLAAYKASPEIRDASEMEPSRLVNRQIAESLLSSPEFAELRRETAGDEYASAMAVIAQTGWLRQVTEQAREAQQAADAAAAAAQQAQQAAGAVQAAVDAAGLQAGDGGEVPGDAAQAAATAISQAESAGQAAADAAGTAADALAAAAAGMRQSARAAAAAAAGQARDEAALMESWGIGPGELKRMPFEDRARLSHRLRNGRLRDFASLIGRFRRMAAGERARRIQDVPGETAGVTLSGDLTRLVSSEAASLAVPALRAVFAARYAEDRLLTYRTHGTERAGQGAIIACVDSSRSMEIAHAGVTREAWSKALALALLDQARAARRDMAVIHFGEKSELKIFRFPAGQPARIADVIDMAEFWFRGGTDFETPLDAAAGLVENEFGAPGQGADIVFLSDGVCQVSGQFQGAWQDRKAASGFRVWGISLAAAPSQVMKDLCDNVRGIEDLTEPGIVADMFQEI